jgi:hypothetical protein
MNPFKRISSGTVIGVASLCLGLLVVAIGLSHLSGQKPMQQGLVKGPWPACPYTTIEECKRVFPNSADATEDNARQFERFGTYPHTPLPPLKPGDYAYCQLFLGLDGCRIQFPYAEDATPENVKRVLAYGYYWRIPVSP